MQCHPQQLIQQIDYQDFETPYQPDAELAADAPRYSCICVIHAPRNKGAYDSGLDCGSVVRKIAEKTMVYTSEYRIEDKQLVMKAKED